MGHEQAHRALPHGTSTDRAKVDPRSCTDTTRQHEWAGPHPRARANDHQVEGESEWGSPSPSAPLETGT